MKFYPSVTIIVLIWILSVSMIFFIGKEGNFFESLSNWDGGHYIGIAQNGYSEKFQYAFFPLYPITINLLNNFVGNYLLSAVLISIISTFFGLQLLYKLMSLDFDRKIADKVIAGILIFPTSFYFLTAYSEGLFFLLTIAAFYFLRTRKLFWAVVFASLASATRLSGLAVVLGLIIEVYLTEGINKKNWYILLSPLGFLIYCYFLYTNTGDPFYFITAENHWLRSLSIPGLGFWETLKSIFTPQFIEKNITAVTDLIFSIFGLGMVIRAFRFLPISYCLFAFISVALPLFTPSLSSIPRFLLPVFPIFILLAFIKDRNLSFFYQLLFIMLLSAFSIMYISGKWVA
ncbi:hypothetical protein A3C59_04925 [Candidatus Daviesbacteria bacterium RIFCSPHIGHO2_02_FULL_36_13]|uniref:Glycosyltransferase RgtA/B/C/D-like domain-containing protein n=1 Tax=Candidatus Daviesbacteria bacterium RIFCSPHIGHO2_02_FULL_36_13 TaxID=1797768 RepID=A0A1F5JNQ0_9BACT|nr:MAG: hypothetical protein A3C59_04925 [Candidatus Daviesbacteria bacterium RIFCSPHIGHO2_02_FULL_36_13]